MRHDRRQRGYSLIEVLVAFAILAMALTVLLRIFSSGLRNVDAAGEYAQAVLLAEAAMAVPGILEPLQPGVTEGSVDGDYKWQREVKRYDLNGEAADGALAPYHITVDVSWPSRRNSRSVHLETIRLAAAGSLAGRIK